jgi:glycosyltransferase involved in cell wall biosynthesis
MAVVTSKRLKILHLISGDLWAGAEAVALNLLKQLKYYEDMDTSVIIFNDGKLADGLRSIGVNTHVIDEKRHSFCQILHQTWGLIGSIHTDIIHSHRYKENILAYLLSQRCSGIKLVSTQHGLPELFSNKKSITQQIKIKINFIILSRYFRTVAVSEDICNTLIKRYGFRKDRVEVIHNGFEIPEYFPPQAGERPFTIGTSGRMFPVKDYPLMVEIARSVSADSEKNIQFVLAGDGPERLSIAALLVKHGLDSNFKLRGHVDDMNLFYQGLDIYVNTSIHEGIPMTILEALGHGLPVVAPAIGGIMEIVEDGKEGFLIKSRDPNEFAEKCILLKNDKALRKKMSSAARSKAEAFFSAERMAEKYYKLYRSITS